MSSHNTSVENSDNDDDGQTNPLLGTTSQQVASIIKQRANDVCGHCMKKCTKSGKGSHALQCDYCNYWFHRECEGMDKETYESFSKLAEVLPNINYYCVFSRCKGINDEMLRVIGPTVKKVEENTKRIEILETDFHKQSSEIDDKIVREVKLNTEDIIESKVKDVWNTERERVKRLRNVLVTEVPEQSGTSEEKQRKDRDEVEKLFKDHLELSESDFKIQGTWRIGREDLSAPKPRLLKVILDREYMVATILKVTRKLTISDDPNIKKIIIFRDLTKEDRVIRNKLVAEMKAKNEILKSQTDPGTGEIVTDKWVIRGDKVILVDKDFKPKHF